MLDMVAIGPIGGKIDGDIFIKRRRFLSRM
jgi:hypothetical protein